MNTPQYSGDWQPLDEAEMRALFDMIVGTMDWGSGFFETDEIMLLRKLAEYLGVDPMLATDDAHRKIIKHEFTASEVYPEECRWCRYSGGHTQIHGGEA